MRYFIDTEFDGYRGPLISMALVREDGRSIYFVMEGAEEAAKDEWVIANVLPILRDCPEPPWVVDRRTAAGMIQRFLEDDSQPHVIADWPDDLRHFCDLVVFGPGEMIGIPALRLEVRRVDAYPNDLPGQVQHNAWWDAVALREKIQAGDFSPVELALRPFEVGDIVGLCSSAQLLTVTGISAPLPAGMIEVAWFGQNGELHIAAMPREALTRR